MRTPIQGEPRRWFVVRRAGGWRPGYTDLDYFGRPRKFVYQIQPTWRDAYDFAHHFAGVDSASAGK